MVLAVALAEAARVELVKTEAAGADLAGLQVAWRALACKVATVYAEVED